MNVRDVLDGLRFALHLWHGPAPIPHVVKRRVIHEYAKRFRIRTFVETGTYLGDMLAAMSGRFDDLYSVELSDVFFDKACARFAREPHIHLRRGDSARVLPEILAELRQPALFWLDAHYSGGSTARGVVDTPVADELVQLLAGAHDHVILIDDARDFNGTHGYPTIEQLREMVAAERPSYELSVAQDIIRITRSSPDG
jgi:hypothetical protein